jgi:2-polyprenyl-3-methyl-5-hydroxy-6-metoxy-1,4-benzoquinol methylase
MTMPEERDALTAHIRSMYEEFPFPNCAYRRKQGLELGVYLARAARRGARSLLAEGVSVLDAGCGTGSTVIPLARAYPQSQFVGLDMNGPSLEIAERDARALGLSNLRFVQADLHTLDLGRRFDVVLCFGVLIVMADPDAGLARLSAHTASDGRLVLWLYGSHGRYRLQLNQRLIALLTAGAARRPSRS